MNTATSIKKILASPTIKKIFLQSGICHVSFFGSYATGEAHEESDLDLLIDLENGHTVTFGTLGELELLLQKKLHIPSVDFVTRKSINPRLKSLIQKELITVF